MRPDPLDEIEAVKAEGRRLREEILSKIAALLRAYTRAFSEATRLDAAATKAEGQ